MQPSPYQPADPPAKIRSTSTVVMMTNNDCGAIRTTVHLRRKAATPGSGTGRSWYRGKPGPGSCPIRRRHRSADYVSCHHSIPLDDGLHIGNFVQSGHLCRTRASERVGSFRKLCRERGALPTTLVLPYDTLTQFTRSRKCQCSSPWRRIDSDFRTGGPGAVTSAP